MAQSLHGSQPVLPPNLTDQLLAWQRDRERLRLEPATLLERVEPEAFARVRAEGCAALRGPGLLDARHQAGRGADGVQAPQGLVTRPHLSPAPFN